jgi:hypothetical protein
MNHVSGDGSSGCHTTESEHTSLCGTGAAMQIHVDEQSHLDDLLAFLRKIGCIALRVDGSTLEVHVPEVTNERAERLELRAYLSSWQARHPEAEAKMLG